MRDLLKAFGNFYIYSSVHIAICAGLLTLESYVILQIVIDLNVVLFVTFSTMSVYSLHRIVGMSKVKAFDDQGRYLVIKKFRHHILIYFIISSLAAAYCFFLLPKEKIIHLAIPGILTIAYVLPVMGSKKRLRDLPFIKIFLIAIVWTWLTLFLPTQYKNITLITLLTFERILFFIAITIPFDIRDFTVDGSIGVKTLIHQLGVKKSKILSQVLLTFGMIILAFLLAQKLINLPVFGGLISTYLCCIFLIRHSDEHKGDWFYGGLLDGTIGLRLVLILLYSYVLT